MLILLYVESTFTPFLSFPPPRRRGPERGPSEQELLTPLASLTFWSGCHLSLSDGAGCLKRKGATTKKEPRKRRKVTEPEEPSEDLLVATALSRSETEQKAVPAALRLGNAFAERTRLGAGAAADWGAEKPGRRQLPKLPLGSPVGG